MSVRHWAMGLVNQIIGWITRPRNIGIALLSISSAVLLSIAGGFSIKAQNIGGILQGIEFSTGGGLVGNLLTLVVYISAGTWFIGLALTLWTQFRDWKEADTRRILVLEMRGLVDTSDKPLLKAIPRTLLGRRDDCLVDVRRYLAGPNPNVQEALKEVSHVQRQIRQARGDAARADVQVVAGGVMQVPLLFYAGTLLDDEGAVLLFDWERTRGDWRQLNDADDGERFAVTGLDRLGNGKEVVLAVSASYLASLDDIATTFPGMPLVRMERANPQPNSLWSEEAQAALTQQFLQVLGKLANQGVKVVHLVLAAPATLALRFGKAYDHRNMPELRCYQREQGETPPYPWSIKMPAANEPVAYLRTKTSISNQSERSI